MIIGLFIISAIILIKYKPMYSIKLGNKKLGYIEKIESIDKYIEEAKNNESIAFVEFKEQPEFSINLVSRNTKDSEQELKEKIQDNLSIEYTSYAVTFKGKNITYLPNKDEAENVIDKLNETKNSKDLGILQVYSDNYDEIKSVSNDEAKTKIAKAIKENNNNEVKVASTKLNTRTTKTTTSRSMDSRTTKTKSKKIAVNLSKPISGIITSRFGGRSSPGGIGSTNHKGLDIANKTGSTIKAAASGTVKFAGYKGSLGNLVIIDNGSKIETYYGHCSKLYVKKGQKVNIGDKIAAVGSTGAATGPHLHFEIHISGTAVNPQNYLY